TRAPKGAPGHPAKITLDLRKYGGRWVATRHGRVVVVGNSYREVAAQVSALGLQEEVILTLVPATGEFLT
ncbi:MAG TPA: DUF5678 domain-containing protein, partial [Candidatus Thermoplasmatota archaeon]|nr:DUF5678 domain-containing protein [Candidatus Thermoplasmatota archaeon]